MSNLLEEIGYCCWPCWNEQGYCIAGQLDWHVEDYHVHHWRMSADNQVLDEDIGDVPF
tara:strand:+ start:1155 stop:1328 length:174 start_codon:yes stop_codon:yes gene_type:complete